MRPIVQFAVGIVRIVADNPYFQPALKKTISTANMPAMGIVASR
jgi:hypothetical protein